MIPQSQEKSKKKTKNFFHEKFYFYHLRSKTKLFFALPTSHIKNAKYLEEQRDANFCFSAWEKIDFFGNRHTNQESTHSVGCLEFVCTFYLSFAKDISF
jgi:hypothetical protein